MLLPGQVLHGHTLESDECVVLLTCTNSERGFKFLDRAAVSEVFLECVDEEAALRVDHPLESSATVFTRRGLLEYHIHAAIRLLDLAQSSQNDRLLRLALNQYTAATRLAPTMSVAWSRRAEVDAIDTLS